ncbi:MAG: beta-1,3-glucanase family protein [Actinomycetota bacterium]|nr:beta-1,3-glucanase family protein [Actinomycetota bacterium]
MDSAGRIAWIGSMAVALGIAGAAAAPPAISWADAADSGSEDSSATSDSPTRSPGTPNSRTSDASPSDADDSADRDASDAGPGHQSGSPPGKDDSGDDADPDSDDDDIDVDSADEDIADEDADRAESDSGNHSGATDSEPVVDASADEPSDPQADAELPVPEVAAEQDASPAVSASQPVEVSAAPAAAEAAEVTVGAAPATGTTVLAAPFAPAPPSTPVPAVAPLAALAWMRRDDEPTLLVPVTQPGAAAQTVAVAAGGPTPAAAASPPVGSILTSIESMLTAARNWFERTFFAATPVYSPQTVSVTAEPVSASDPFALTAVDADGRALSYTVRGSAEGTGTAAGTLTISGDSATYTPPASWDGVTAYTDTFSVTASDARDAFHIHGLSGLLNALTFGLLGRAGHTATTTLTVEVRAASTPPGPDPDPPTPPDGPGVPGSFPVSFVNDSDYADDQVHLFVIGQVTPGQWSWVDRDGVAHHIDHAAADAPGHLEKDGVNYADMTFTLAEADGLRIPPELLGGRIYVSLDAPLYIGIAADNSGWASPDGANPADPNYDTVYDWYELSYQNGSVPFGGNTTQVDQFGFPFTFTVSQDGFSATRGIAISRAEVFTEFEDTVPDAFQALIIRDQNGDPLRILAPRSHQPGELATWFDEPVDEFWNSYRTEEFRYDGPGYTVTGHIGADDRFAYTVTAADGSATSHTMAKPTTGEVFRADGPFVGTGLQGAFLAELDAAFNRGVAASPGSWNDVSAYYPTGGRWNDWAHFFHANSIDGFAYGFPYDDVNSQSSVVILGNSEPLSDLRLTLRS